MYMLRNEAPRPITKNTKKNFRSLKGKGLEGVVLNAAGSFPSSILDCMVFPQLSTNQTKDHSTLVPSHIIKSHKHLIRIKSLTFQRKTKSTQTCHNIQISPHGASLVLYWENQRQAISNNRSKPKPSTRSHQTTKQNQLPTKRTMLTPFKNQKDPTYEQIKSLVPRFPGKGGNGIGGRIGEGRKARKNRQKSVRGALP